MSRKRETKARSFQQNTRPDVNQAQQAYLQAQKLQQSGYLTEAEKLYRQILEVLPEQPDCLHYLGMVYMQKGDLDQADKYMQQSIKLGNNPVYLCNYGLLLSNRRHEEAIKQYEKALQLKPDYAEAWYNLGVSYDNTGKLEEAENAYKKAVSYRKNYIKALYNLACVQEMQSKTTDARQTIDHILSISADSAEVHNILGAALTRIGGSKNLKMAEQHFRQALTDRPDYLEAYINLGKLFEGGNQIEDAIKCYSRVLELEPENIEAAINLAFALISNDQLDQAGELLEKIQESHAANAKVLCGLGNIKRINGDFGGAAKLYEQALGINPSESLAYYGLSIIRKFTDKDDIFISEVKNLSGLDAMANYALGKIYSDIGDYDESFAYYRKANELRNRSIDYDAQVNRELTGRIIRIFSKDMINRLQAGGNPAQMPVFILGAPRSGTTLVEQIISSHPGVYGAGELDFILRQVTSMKNTDSLGVGYPECINTVTPDGITQFAGEYIRNISALCTDSNVKKITDKMPGNFLYTGYIASLFPNAAIIHCRRNPLDTCLSIYFQSFNAGHRYSFDLENLGNWYKDYLDLMAHWNRVLGDRIYNLDYDEVVNNTEETTRKLIDYCGLEWNDQCLQFHTTERKVRTASQWQVRQPVYKTSLERWKRYDKHIGPLKEILAGYY